MDLIDRAGTFRGSILSHAVGATKNGFPQWTPQLYGAELYDEELGEWVDWTAVPENELTAYLVLYDSKNEQTLNHRQVEKVTGWDGTDFEELENMDLSETGIQFRVAENTYDGKTNLQVEWIDEYDATPGRITRRLDPAELKALSARFIKTKKAPATAAKPTATEAKEAIGAAINSAKAKQTVDAIKKDPPKAPPTRKPPKPPATTKATPPSGATKGEVWNNCVEFKRDNVTDKKFSEVWTEEINKVAPDKTDDQITAEEWGVIGNAIMDKTGKF